MTGESFLTRQLIEHLWSTGSDQNDEAAARRLLLDHIAVGAWGSRLDAARTMATHALVDLEQGGPRLPIVGTGDDASALAAAMANSVAASAYEFDDTHTAASVHPGVVVFPAAMAAARLSDADGATLLRSVIIGYEVMCRVGRAAGGQAHRRRHFHPTSTTGHFGAAATAAICLRLGVDEALAAISLAGTMAGGSMQFLHEGASTKQVHSAFAVQRGVQAAQLAGHGFPGLSEPIAGSRGFLAAQSADPHPECLVEGLGEQPSEIRLTGVKPYPSCRNTQSPLDALFQAVDGTDVGPGLVERVEFGLVEPGLRTIFEPKEVKRRPRTLVDAQFSMPYVAAVALLDGVVTPSQFEEPRFSDPDVLALADRVVCVHDPELDREYPAHWPAWARLITSDGRVLEGRVMDPKGDPSNPLSWEELTTKFRSLTQAMYTSQEQARIESAVEAMGENGSFARLIGALGRAEP